MIEFALEKIWTFLTVNIGVSYSWLVVIIFFIVLFKWVVMPIYRRYSNHKKKHETINKDISSIKNSIDSINAKLSSIETTIESNFKAFGSAFKSIAFASGRGFENFNVQLKSLTEKNSPRKLNKNGEKIYELIGGEDFLSTNENFFFERIKEKNPQNYLDIERFSFEVLAENVDDNVFNTLKDKIYASPEVEIEIYEGDDIEEPKMVKKEIGISEACIVLSVPLRDRYIKSIEPNKSQVP